LISLCPVVSQIVFADSSMIPMRNAPQQNSQGFLAPAKSVSHGQDATSTFSTSATGGHASAYASTASSSQSLMMSGMQPVNGEFSQPRRSQPDWITNSGTPRPSAVVGRPSGDAGYVNVGVRPPKAAAAPPDAGMYESIMRMLGLPGCQCEQVHTCEGEDVSESDSNDESQSKARAAAEVRMQVAPQVAARMQEDRKGKAKFTIQKDDSYTQKSVTVTGWDGRKSVDILDALPPPTRKAPAAMAEAQDGTNPAWLQYALLVKLDDQRSELLLFTRDANLEREAANFLRTHQLSPQCEDKLLRYMFKMVQQQQMRDTVDIVDLI